MSELSDFKRLVYEPERQKARDEIAKLRGALVRFVEHFGPLEDNHMLHPDARGCFQAARGALGPELHNLAIKAGLTDTF